MDWKKLNILQVEFVYSSCKQNHSPCKQFIVRPKLCFRGVASMGYDSFDLNCNGWKNLASHRGIWRTTLQIGAQANELPTSLGCQLKKRKCPIFNAVLLSRILNELQVEICWCEWKAPLISDLILIVCVQLCCIFYESSLLLILPFFTDEFSSSELTFFHVKTTVFRLFRAILRIRHQNIDIAAT